jgi:predicted permease
MISAIRVFIMRLFGKSVDPRLEEEIAAHLQMLAEEFESKGMPKDKARAAARREFGPVIQIREAHREWRRLPLLDSIMQDLAYAFRQIRANPGFVAAAILTLGLGIGANTAIFAVLDRIVLRPLPVDDPGRLVMLRPELQMFGVPLMREMNARQNLVKGIFASGALNTRGATVGGRELAEPAIQYATGNYFRLLGAHAQIGRLLTEADDDATAAPAAVISDRFWRRQFGGQATVLGATFSVDDKIVLTVVGVTEPDFYGERLGQIPDAWIPMSLVAQISPINATRSSAWLTPMARLRDDVPLDHAQAGLSVLLNQLMPEYGMQLRGLTDYKLRLIPARQGLANLNTQFSAPLWLLMGMVTFVVLITCCNLANLLLARGIARSHEVAIRLAIGASRRRVIRQLLTESLVVAGFGGVLGLALSYWGSRALTALAFAGEKQELMMGIGWRITGFAMFVSIVAACLFGLVPALTTSRIDLNSALQAGGRSHTGGRSRRVAAKCFGIAQLAISMLLVAGAILLVNSFWRIIHQDMGYQRDGILTFHTAFDAASFSALRNRALLDTILERLSAIPGIQSTALHQGGPLGAVTSRVLIALPERPSQKGEELHRIDVSPQYFDTMGTRILSGRAFTEADRSKAPRVAVITETAARSIFGTTNPVGRLFTDGPEFKDSDVIEVVGISHDIRFSNLREPFKGIVFMPMAQSQPYTMPTFVLKTGTSPMRFAEPVKQAVREIAPNLRIEKFQPWDEVVGLTVRNEHLLAWLSGAFGLLAIILASVGMYGVVAYGAERSIRELGIRTALGARPRQLHLLLLREITMMLIAGIALGSAATLILGKWIRALLFDLAPYDPITLISAVTLLAFAVLLAAYIPARAARLDPLAMLRQQ